MIGQAAGVTAYLAIQGNTPVQQVSVEKLQTILRKDGSILHLDQQAHRANSRIHPQP
ncbi:MAG: hypothetical protein V4734_02185 [Terriglobus sp.]